MNVAQLAPLSIVPTCKKFHAPWMRSLKMLRLVRRVSIWDPWRQFVTETVSSVVYPVELYTIERCIYKDMEYQYNRKGRNDEEICINFSERKISQNFQCARIRSTKYNVVKWIHATHYQARKCNDALTRSRIHGYCDPWLLARCSSLGISTK